MKRIFSGIIFLANMVIWQGCVYNSIPLPVDCGENPVALQEGATTQTACGLSEGSIEVIATGGTGAYQFRLDEGEFQESPVFNGLAAGLYRLSAIDENNCVAELQVAVTNSDGFNIAFQTSVSGCGTATGSISVTPVSGVAPFSYQLNGGSFQPGNSFLNVSHGLHTVVVSDATGCVVTQKVRVTSGVSYASEISQIITNSCAISGCHNGTQFPDFRLFKNIQDNASLIKEQTMSRTMPLEGTLTQAQINAIACWVDDGAPAN